MIAPRRFWSEVAIIDGGIRLDDKPLRTPAGAPLLLPAHALAEAIAAEWRAADGAIDPRAMPLTGFANAAIDRVARDHAGFASAISAYAASDLLCYRADAPDSLIAAQAAAWNPPLDWARARYDIEFVVTAGIVPVAQPPATLARLGAAVAAFDDFVLAALQSLVTVSGSLVLALALAERTIDAVSCWAAADLDDRWQAERWGDDALATATRAAHRGAFLDAARFLELVGASSS